MKIGIQLIMMKLINYQMYTYYMSQIFNFRSFIIIYMYKKKYLKGNVLRNPFWQRTQQFLLTSFDTFVNHVFF